MCVFIFSCLLDSCEAETKSFLACKEQWKTEIEEKLEKLKMMERDLSNKEKELLEVREREGGEDIRGEKNRLSFSLSTEVCP